MDGVGKEICRSRKEVFKTVAANLINLQCRNVLWTSECTNWEGGAIIMNNTLSQICQLRETNSGIVMDAAKANILVLKDARNS